MILAALSRAEDAALLVVTPVIFAVVEAVEGWRVSPWKAALAEQRKGVGEKREVHLERASRLREIGWAEMVEQHKKGIGR